MRPTLVVVDAMRVLMRNGPQGGNIDDTKDMNTVIATVDQVAADAYGCTLIGQTPREPPLPRDGRRAGPRDDALGEPPGAGGLSGVDSHGGPHAAREPIPGWTATPGRAHASVAARADPGRGRRSRRRSIGLGDRAAIRPSRPGKRPR